MWRARSTFFYGRPTGGGPPKPIPAAGRVKESSMNPEADRLTFAKLVLAPNAVAEVRAIGVPRVDIVSGWFETPERLAEAIGEADNLRGQGVYVTMNPVNAALLGRRANRLAPVGRRGTTTADKDILARRWLLVDFDAERPTDVSSTDEEHAAALLRASQARITLGEAGWPEPVVADSGNGAHLFYRIDLANDDASKELVRRVLVALDLQFGGDGVNVDTSVFNSARVVKAPGTMVRKGDNISGRPHRRAQLLSVPDELRVVSCAQLEALAAQIPAELTSDRGTRNGSGRINLLAFLDAAGIEHDDARPFSGGHLWRLWRCPFSDAHRDGAFAMQFANGTVVVRCHHNSCQGKGWADLRRRFPDALRAAVAKTGSRPGDGERRRWDRTAEPQVVGPVIVRLSDVEARPIEWLWAGRIARGELTLMVGDPGEGKGLVSADIAARLTRGDPLPGQVGEPTEPCTVVVLSGEDHPNTVLRPRYEAAGADLDRVVLVPGKLVRQDFGGNLVEVDDGSRDEPCEVPIYLTDLEPLRQVLRETEPHLLIVDPLQQYLGPQVDARRANQTRPVLDGLARLAREFNVAVLVLYHLNKDASQTKAIYRALDSIDIPAASRLVLLVGHDPDDEAKRAVLTVKSNLGRKPEGLGFEIAVMAAGVPFIRWTGPTELTEDRLLGASTRQRGRPGKVAEAQAWLLDLLRPLGEEGLAVAEIVELGKAEGFSQRTLERAKTKAGIISRRLREDEGEGWTWAAWTHCWRCESLLGIETHERCQKCGWLRCDCGACRKGCPGTLATGSPKTANPSINTANTPGFLAALPQSQSGQGFGTPPSDGNFGGLGDAAASLSPEAQGLKDDLVTKTAKNAAELADSNGPSNRDLSQHRQNSWDIGADAGGPGGLNDSGTVEAAFDDLTEVRL